MKKTDKKLTKMQRKVRNARKKWTKLEKFSVVQDNLVRNAIAKDQKPPKRKVKRKLNPTQQFEQRQHRLKNIRPVVIEETPVVEHIHGENCNHEMSE